MFFMWPLMIGAGFIDMIAIYYMQLGFFSVALAFNISLGIGIIVSRLFQDEKVFYFFIFYLQVTSMIHMFMKLNYKCCV